MSTEPKDKATLCEYDFVGEPEQLVNDAEAIVELATLSKATMSQFNLSERIVIPANTDLTELAAAASPDDAAKILELAEAGKKDKKSAQRAAQRALKKEMGWDSYNLNMPPKMVKKLAFVKKHSNHKQHDFFEKGLDLFAAALCKQLGIEMPTDEELAND